MLPQISAFLIASVLLTLSPGPDIIYVLVRSIASGKKAGIITSLGLVSGILVHTSLVAFGVSAVISRSEELFLAIRLFGAAYLFYLAYKVYRSETEFSLASSAAGFKERKNLFRQGFIMNILNPKVTIFFLAFFPAFLWAPEENTVYQFYILGTLFMLQAFLIFSLVSLLAGRIAVYLQKQQNAGIVLKWLQIFIFTGIAVFILI